MSVARGKPGSFLAKRNQHEVDTVSALVAMNQVPTPRLWRLSIFFSAIWGEGARAYNGVRAKTTEKKRASIHGSS